MTTTLWNELNDQVSEKTLGGFANPDNNGQGSANSFPNGAIAVFKSNSALETSPNSPKFGLPGGVANSDHFFQLIGVIGKN